MRTRPVARLQLLLLRMLLKTTLIVCLTGLATAHGSPLGHRNLTGNSAVRPSQRILLFYSSEDAPAKEVHQNAVMALDDARFSYDEFDIASSSQWPALERYTTILIATELIRNLEGPQVKPLITYIEAGGNLVVIYRSWNRALAPIFGAELANIKQRLELLTDSSGLKFYIDLVPGISGLTLDKDTVISNGSYALTVNLEALVLAGDNQRRPLAWLHAYGRGRTLYWNTTFLSSKLARGLIIQSILAVQPIGVLPIANVATVDIDGFPAPLSHQRFDPVAEEYNLATDEFYRQVWLPDMLDLARRYNIPFTFFARFADNKKLPGPFDFAAWETYKIKLDNQTVPYSVYAARLISQEHRLGIVGYDSRPLNLKNWSSKEEMIASLKAAADRWRADNLGPPPQVLSAEDMIDTVGAGAIAQAFPALKVVGTSYLKDYEFGSTKDLYGIFIYPRATTGYEMLPTEQLAMLSQLGGMGIWTHVIDPDDLFANPENYPDTPPYRNPDALPWRGDSMGKIGLYHRLEQWLDFNKTHYPWLRYMSTAEAYPYISDHLQNKVITDIAPEAISVQSDKPTYFQIRINNEAKIDPARIQGAEIVHVYDGKWYRLYTLKGTISHVIVPFAGPIERASDQGASPTSSFETPAAGELIITEFMVNAVGQEWFEVYNRTNHYLNLAGLKLNIAGNEHLIDPTAVLKIAPKGYAVVAQTKGPDNGLNPRQVLYAYGTDLKLGEQSGFVELRSDKDVINRVSYDLQDRWPIQQGISVALLPAELTTDDHRNGMKWCQSIKALPNNPRMYGTPGQPNHTCMRSTPLLDSSALAVQSGELVITEIMPRVTDLRNGPEWLEIFNPTDHPVSLRGVTISTRTLRGHTITADIAVNPGQYMVLAQSDILGNMLPKNLSVYHYDLSIKLNNIDDALYLRRGFHLIDAVVFDKTRMWPLEDNVAMSLHPGAYSAYLNDDALNWCSARMPIAEFANHRGTPGLPNDRCPMWGIDSPFVDNRTVYSQDSIEPVIMRVKVDPAHLEFMTSNPFTRQRFPAVFESSGFNAVSTVPNATLRIRGASTRRALQKSFSILLDQGEFRGQKTIQLNRHFYDHSRLRNYTGLALFQNVDNMVSLRTQFVYLYINGKDYGLFTQVERVGGRFARSHHLDDRGALFKVSCVPNIPCFSFQAPTAEARARGRIDGLDIEIGPGYDGLFKMLEDLHSLEDINLVIERHFNRSNLITFLASMYLVGQLDVINQNFILYSTPREPDRFYFIPWDLDGAFQMQHSQSLVASRWWRGFGYLSQSYLWKRFLQDPQNVRDVLAKIDELYKTSLSRRALTAIVERGAVQVAPFVSRRPEIDAYLDEPTWQIELEDIEGSIDDRYFDLATTVRWPMPVYTSLKYQPDNTLLFSWEESYALDGSPVTYELVFFDSERWNEEKIVHRIRGIKNSYLELQSSDFPGSMRGKGYRWMVYTWTEKGEYQTSYTGTVGRILSTVNIP